MKMVNILENSNTEIWQIGYKKEKLEQSDKGIISNKRRMIFTGTIVFKDTAQMKENQAHTLSLLKPSQS